MGKRFSGAVDKQKPRIRQTVEIPVNMASRMDGWRQRDGRRLSRNDVVLEALIHFFAHECEEAHARKGS